MIFINWILKKMGYIKKSEVIKQLHYARSVGKRLDEHREVVESIYKNTDFFSTHFWHIGHMAIQDDYLMRLYYLVYDCFPDESERLPGDHLKKQDTGEYIRPRPTILGKCLLTEYKSQVKNY